MIVSFNSRLFDIGNYIERRENRTLVAYWKDGRATIPLSGIKLDNPLLEAVKILTHGKGAKVLTLQLGRRKRVAVR